MTNQTWGQIKLFYYTHLEKRVKSLVWRTAVGFGIGLIAIILDIVPEMGLPAFATYLLINVLNECTKWLNNNTELFGKKLK